LLSVCTIFRNEEDFLPGWLDNILPFADELVLVDTGSTDKSRSIINDRGLEVVDFSWCDDFSAARNFSLSLAKGDWVLVLDCDDRLLSADFQNLLDFLSSSSSKADGYLFNYLNVKSGKWDAADRVLHSVQTQLRLFRNFRNYSYSGIVHENIAPSIEAAGGNLAQSPVPIYHLGYAGELFQKKKQRNLKLIERYYREQPQKAEAVYLYACARFGREMEVYVLLKKAFELAVGELKLRCAEKILLWLMEYGIDNKALQKETVFYESYLLSSSSHAGVAFLKKAREFYEAGNTEQAFFYYRRVYDSIDCSGAGSFREEVYVRSGELSAICGDFSGAEAIFREHELYYGRTPFIYYQLCKLYFVAGQYDKFAVEISDFPDNLISLPYQERLQLLSGIRKLPPKTGLELEKLYISAAEI
jgi:glycosyltransferase involved in cell wall biosynthesis